MMRLEFAPSLLQRPVRALRRSYGAASDEPSVFDECFAAMLTLPILADLLDKGVPMLSPL